MRDNLVIIRVDGGICSQISFVALGSAFEAKGYEVQYDLSWFEEQGIGAYNPSNGYDKVYNVSFDIPKAFPTLPIKIAEKTEAKHYKRFYFANNDNIITFSPPLYVGGYLGRHFDGYFKELFRQHFIPKESEQRDTAFAKVKEEICSSMACGVHVRRGDLSGFHPVYGEPTALEYFTKAISLIESIQPESVFYIFSDDVKWVKQHFPPILKDRKYRICDVNTPSEGYLDLYLLSLCKNLIGSQGSLAMYAKLLSPHNPLLICPKIRDWLFKQEPNVMFVNWGEAMQLQPLELNSTISYSPPPHTICQKQIPIMALLSLKKQIVSQRSA